MVSANGNKSTTAVVKGPAEIQDWSWAIQLTIYSIPPDLI
jgi:hypothetical protein